MKHEFTYILFVINKDEETSEDAFNLKKLTINKILAHSLQ